MSKQYHTCANCGSKNADIRMHVYKGKAEFLCESCGKKWNEFINNYKSNYSSGEWLRNHHELWFKAWEKFKEGKEVVIFT